MPLPLLIPLALAAAGSGASIYGQLKNRPRKPSYNPNAYYEAARETAFQNANQASSNAGLQLGPQLRAAGIEGSGVGAGMLAKTAGGIYGEALRGLPMVRAQGLGRQAELNDQYARDKGEWNSNLYNDIGSSLGQIGGTLAGMRGLQQESLQNDAFLKEMERLGYGGDIADAGGQGTGGEQTLTLRQLLEIARRMRASGSTGMGQPPRAY